MYGWRGFAVGLFLLGLGAPAWAQTSSPTVKGLDTANVLAYGADPTGVADSTAAINAALTSVNAAGVVRNVYLPCGVYHVTNSLTLGTVSGHVSQSLIGDGWCSVIDVSTDFNTSATGVVVMALNTNGAADVQYGLENLDFRFHQPPDASTTTTSTSAIGATTITVASVPANVVVGSFVTDKTNSNAIANFLGAGANNQSATITDITGNVITLSTAILSPGVGSGDIIDFAQPRSAFTTLTGGCSLVAGKPGCKYPWAIYNNGMQEAHYSHLLIEGGWDGIYQRGSTYRLNYVYGGVLDVLFDQDGSANFPQLDELQLQTFGLNNTATSALPNGGPAFIQAFYDGNTTCANLGRNDGLAAGKIQCWTGKLNLTSTWTYGQINELMMDGSNAGFFANGTSGGFLQIGQMYSTKGKDSTIPVQILGGRVLIGTFYGTSTSGNAGNAAGDILVTGGELHIFGGHLFAGETVGIPDVLVSGGLLEIRNMELDSGSGCGAMASHGYITQSSTGVLIVDGVDFTDSCAATRIGVKFATDVAGNWVDGVTNWNGWTLTGPTGPFATGPLGHYMPPISQANNKITGGTGTQRVTDRTLLLTGGGGGGINFTMDGCGVNNDGQRITFIDGTGTATTGPMVLTPTAGSIITSGTTSYTMAINYATVTFTCQGQITTWVLN